MKENKKLISTLNSIVCGNLNLIEGCRIISSMRLSNEISFDRSEEYLQLFRIVDSETDHLLLKDLDKLNFEYAEKIKAEMNEYLIDLSPAIIQSCPTLLNLLQNKNKKAKMIEIFHKHFGFRSEFSENDYLYAFGKASNSLLYSFLFLPELLEIEKVVFLKKNVYDVGLIKEELVSGDKTKEILKLELSYNYIEVGYLFDCPGRDLSEDEEALLADRIRASWDGWLKISYPNRKFTVEIVSAGITGSSIGVQFYENR